METHTSLKEWNVFANWPQSLIWIERSNILQVTIQNIIQFISNQTWNIHQIVWYITTKTLRLVHTHIKIQRAKSL